MEWLKEQKLNDPVNLDKVRRLKVIAEELNVPMAQFALAWCLKNPNVSTVLLGASRVEQLKENLGALDVVTLLTQDVMNRIENILQNKPM